MGFQPIVFELSANHNLEKYRDLFVLGCLTGFRFSDYSDTKPEEVRGGMLYVNQTKTLSTVVVPLRSDAKKILIDKYNMQMPQVSNPNFNVYIREVVKLAGIDEMIRLPISVAIKEQKKQDRNTIG